MPSVHTKNLEIYNAKQFIESIGGSGGSTGDNNNVYFTIGRTKPWTSDANPPTPGTSTYDYYYYYKDLIAGKKITGGDMTHCVPRFNWRLGEVYSQFDDIQNSTVLKSPTNDFFVVTDDFHVYKCLANNNGGVSSVKPTSTTTTSHFQTSDGYIWKYMYTISAEDQLKFTTSNFIPVKTLTIPDGSTQWSVQNNAIKGAIHTIQVVSGGTNYTTNNISITITGDGTKKANAFAIRNMTSNTIQSIIVDDFGEGYSRANVFIFTSSAGQGAAARAIMTPFGGHGSDPVNELGGSYVMVSMQMKGSESGKITVKNDFRQVGLLESPHKKGNTATHFSNATFNQTTTLSLSGTGTNFLVDEYVYQGSGFRNSTFRGIVLDWDALNNKLVLNAVDGVPSTGFIIGADSAATRQLVSVEIQPELEVNTGRLLYIDNIQPVTRNALQVEDFKIVLSF